MIKFNTRKNTILAAVITLGVALTLGACSTDDDASSTHNSQDVDFSRAMIPHHGQAVEMARLADTRAQTPRVKELADQIEAAQQPEIDKMNGWLESWGEGTVDPSDPADEHAGHGTSMPGMMSADEMSKLSSTTGTAFDRTFLQMMVEHHNGAIEMAKDESAKGKDAEVRSLAKTIASSQQTEITEMEQLIAHLG